jgi:transcription termination/antitermination protein NusG
VEQSQLTASAGEPHYAGSDTMPHWYAVRVRSNFERTAGIILEHKGVEQFVPTYRSRRRWADRIKTLDVPLFPGYLFCRIPLHRRNVVVTTEGVVGFVGIGREPVAVSQTEIDAIRTVVQSEASAQPWPFLKIGQTVRISGGALAGAEGILIRVKTSWRLVVSVTLLARSVAVEIDAAYVSPVSCGVQTMSV